MQLLNFADLGRRHSVQSKNIGHLLQLLLSSFIKNRHLFVNNNL
jgi:hypothetical protein